MMGKTGRRWPWMLQIFVVMVCAAMLIGENYRFEGNDRLQILKIEGDTEATDMEAVWTGHFTEPVAPGSAIYLRVQSGQIEIEKNGRRVLSKKSQTDSADGDFIFSSEWM